MAKVKVKQDSTIKYVFIITLTIGILIIGFKEASKSSFTSINNDSNSLNEKYEEVTSKGGLDLLTLPA